MTKQEEALKWWDTLNEKAKSKFPKPKNDGDIMKYFINPSTYYNWDKFFNK